MDVQQILTNAQDALTVRRVFGEPMQVDGVTVIPAAAIAGGGGGGAKGQQGGDAGVGFGVRAKPLGVFVVRDGDAHWRPAVDVNRAVLGGQVVAAAAILILGPLLWGWSQRRCAHRDAD